MKNLSHRLARVLAIHLPLAMLLWLASCQEKQDDVSRRATASDLYGTWTAEGLGFESAGQGASLLTQDQVALFAYLKAASYTFNLDGTYLKRSLDSTLSSTQVLSTLERGSYQLTDGQLILTTTDLATQAIRQQYYSCSFEKKSLGSWVQSTLYLHVSKEQLLKALDEQKQPNPLDQPTRDLLLGRDMFRINQTLYQ